MPTADMHAVQLVPSASPGDHRNVTFQFTTDDELALATHNAVDPSLSTAAGGPPTNWVGSFGAYASDLLLLLFGPASAVLLPLVALAGLRMVRDIHGGSLVRALLVAIAGVVLLGIAVAMFAGSGVSGLPAGWGGLATENVAHRVPLVVVPELEREVDKAVGF